MSSPFPLPAHQTGRANFPHPAFRLASPRAYGERSHARPSRSAAPWRRDTVRSDSSRPHRVFQRLSPITRPSPSSSDAPEVRVLPSAGVARPQRYHDPVRHPRGPMPLRIVEAATLARHGAPPLARSPVATCRAHYPGGPVQVRVSAASLVRAAFPDIWAGRRPRLPFRGLLRLHSRYGPSVRSTARGGLCHGASIRPVTHSHRPSATGPTDHCPGGTFTHEVIAPFGAHQRHRGTQRNIQMETS